MNGFDGRRVGGELVGEAVALSVLFRHGNSIGIVVDGPRALGAKDEPHDGEDSATAPDVEERVAGDLGAPLRRGCRGHERRRLVKAGAEGAARLELKDVRDVRTLVSLPRRPDHHVVTSANGLKCFFHSSRHSSPTISSMRGFSDSYEMAANARSAAARSPKLDERRRVRRGALDERRSVALFDAERTELEEQRARLVGGGGVDVDVKEGEDGAGARAGHGLLAGW